MSLYRYRTGALVGPWRDCRDEAIGDAVRAGQASCDQPSLIRWLVPGEIEQADSQARFQRAGARR